MTYSDLQADEEEFHSSYRIFISAVEMLAGTADEQCQFMGDCNVAWELKDDVTAGKFLIGRGYLSNSQEAWVVALIGALSIADTQILPSGNGRQVNLQAMESACWQPLQFLAAEVLKQLALFTNENAKYLQLPPNVA